jgi:hypothetical protein
VVTHRSDVRGSRRAGHQVPTPCRVGGVTPGTCRAAAKGQEVTAEMLAEDRQVEQHTSPVKVMTRIEVEVGLAVVRVNSTIEAPGIPQGELYAHRVDAKSLGDVWPRSNQLNFTSF